MKKCMGIIFIAASYLLSTGVVVDAAASNDVNKWLSDFNCEFDEQWLSQAKIDPESLARRVKIAASKANFQVVKFVLEHEKMHNKPSLYRLADAFRAAGRADGNNKKEIMDFMLNNVIMQQAIGSVTLSETLEDLFAMKEYELIRLLVLENAFAKEKLQDHHVVYLLGLMEKEDSRDEKIIQILNNAGFPARAAAYSKEDGWLK